MEKQNYYKNLSKIDVSKKIEKKQGLSYLSWSWAFDELLKIYPEASYEIEKFENNLPYVHDENTGYMVFTKITIEGVTKEMWLPVMDSNNKAMKCKSYTYDTKYKQGIKVEQCSMFDVNKTIMRCLVKNLGMFGLGLYIYAGEDLPEEVKILKEEEIKQNAEIEKIKKEINSIVSKKNDPKKAQKELYSHFKITTIKGADLEMLKNMKLYLESVA